MWWQAAGATPTLPGIGYSAAMRVVWRSLLLWLLALALPVQGLAAAARMHCAGQAVVGEAASTAHHADHHDQTHAHATHQGPMGAAAMDHDVAPQDGADSPRAGHSCSACAACHAPVGLPAALVVLPAPPMGGFATATGADPGASHVPAGLDRPPRPTQA